MLKESIGKAYKKKLFKPMQKCNVLKLMKTGKFRLFEIRTVVDDLEDEDLEVSLEEAQAINENYQVGDIIETEADIDHIGTFGSYSNKTIIQTKIRETEKKHYI